jgi:hypothetical protein
VSVSVSVNVRVTRDCAEAFDLAAVQQVKDADSEPNIDFLHVVVMAEVVGLASFVDHCIVHQSTSSHWHCLMIQTGFRQVRKKTV